MLIRTLQEALLLAVIGVMAAVVAQRFPRIADLINLAHLPTASLEPHRLMIAGAVAGAARALLHGSVLALQGETLAPIQIPGPVVYLAVAGALVGLVRHSRAHDTGAQALASTVLGAAAGATLGCLPLSIDAYGHEIASAATALILAGLGAIGLLRLRRTADPRGVLVLALAAGVLLATVFVPTGVTAPMAVLVVAALTLAAVALGRTRRGGEALQLAKDRLAPLGERVRTATHERGLTPAIVGIAAGVATNPAYFWTAMTGFPVEEMGLSPRVAGALNGWAFAGLTLGTFFVAPLARRWDQRLLLVQLAVAGAAAMGLLAWWPELHVMQIATFAAAFLALASSIALPPLLAEAEHPSRTSGVYARSWILTIAVLLTVEPIAADWIGWQGVAIGQAGLMLLAAPLMMLPHRSASSRDERGPLAVWGATVRMLGERRVLIFAAIYFLSGGLYGIFNATYAAILGSAGLAERAWIPGLALIIAAFAAKWWGDFSHRHARAGLVVAAVITALAFMAVAPLAFMEEVVLSAFGLLLVVSLQNLAVETGTTGTTVVGPGVLLNVERGEEENALANTAKFAGMAGLGWLGAWLLDSGRLALSVGRPGLLGAGVGVLLVLLSAVVPLHRGAREKPRHAAPRRVRRRNGHAARWGTLAVVALAQLVISIDYTIVNVALPSIYNALEPTLSQVPWIVDAYLLASAVALIPGGLIADRIGRRLALVAGLAIFAGGSVAAALSDAAGWLIAARFVMGVGGGLILPSTFSSLRVAFQDPGEQKAAVGIWSAVGGVGIVLGPLAGGALLRQFEWPAIFWVNLPAVLVLALAARRFVPASRAPITERIDWPGVGLVTGALTALLWGVIQAPTEGWGSTQVRSALGAGILVLVVFCVWQWRCRHPLVDVRLLRDPRFSGASVALALVYFALMGALFLLVTYLDARGYDPLGTGIALTPLAGLLAGGLAARHLTVRFGARSVVAVGFMVIVAGMGLLATVTADSAYLRVGASLGLAGLGLGAALAAAQSAVMAALPESGAGVGSAMQQAVRLIGGAFGVACLSTAAFNVYLDRMASSGTLPAGLPASVAALARQHPSAAIEIADRLGPLGEPLRQAALSAWVVSMRWGLAWAALVAFVGALVALAFLPGRERDRQRPAPARAAIRGRHLPGQSAGRTARATIDPPEVLERLAAVRDELARIRVLLEKQIPGVADRAPATTDLGA